jgi:hypothetical protein
VVRWADRVTPVRAVDEGPGSPGRSAMEILTPAFEYFGAEVQ